MSTPRLRHFLAVANHGSFSAAAAALKVSQPALTKSVQALEAELGVRLFDREPRAVTLTAFGERVAAYARQAVAAEDDLQHELELMAGLAKGRVDVAFGPYPGVLIGYAAAARLKRTYPGLGIGLRIANWRTVTNAVAEREVDLGVAELNDARENASLATEPLGDPRMRFFCRPQHPILARERITLPDLLAFPWAMTRLPPRLAAALPRSGVPAGQIDPRTGDLVPAIEIDVPIGLAGFAIGDTLVPGLFSLLEREIESGTLSVVPTPDVLMRGDYGFIWRRHRTLSPAVRAFMQVVREEERLFAEREARLAAVFAPWESGKGSSSESRAAGASAK